MTLGLILVSRYELPLVLRCFDWSSVWQDMRGWDWGDVPTWIQAIATVLALVAAAYGAVQVFKTLQLESRRDAKQVAKDEEVREREARSQAELVSIWTEQALPGEFRIPPGGIPPEGIPVEMGRLFYANSSQVPMYNSIIILERSGGDPIRLPIFTISPHQTRMKSEAGTQYLNQVLLEEMVARSDFHYGLVLNDLKLFLVFDDAHGQRWQRDQKGKLNRVADDYQLPRLTEEELTAVRSSSPTMPGMPGFGYETNTDEVAPKARDGEGH